MAKVTDLPDFPDSPNLPEMIRQACEVIANVRGIPYDFNGTLSLENKFTVLFQTVKEMFDVAEKLIESYRELYEFIENYFANLDVQEEINKKLDEMAADGTLSALLKVNNTSVYVNCRKVCSLPTGYVYQGFALVSENMGVVGYYQSTDSNTHLKTFILDTGETVTDIDCGKYFHCNNITVFDNLIYVCNSTSSSDIYVYDENLVLQKTITLNERNIICAAFTTDPAGAKWLTVQSSGTVGFFTYFVDGDSLVPFKHFKTPYPRGGYNGFHGSGSAFMYLEPGSLSGGAFTSAVVMMDYSGDVFLRMLLNTPKDMEVEDVSRISGSKYIFVNDAAGNIYVTEDVSNYILSYLPDPTFWTVANNTDYNTYFAYNKTTTKINGKNINNSFKICNPNTNNISLVMGLACLWFEGDYYFAPCYAWSTGTIVFNCTVAHNQGNTMIVRIRFTTSDYRTYSFASIEGIVISKEGVISHYNRTDTFPFEFDMEFMGVFGMSSAKPWWVVDK